MVNRVATCLWVWTPAVLIVGISFACSDRGPTDPETRAEGRIGEAGEIAGETVPLPVKPRFSIELNVVGALRPNAPIQVIARTRALAATNDVQIRLFAPEVEAAKLSSWYEDYTIPDESVPIPPLAAERRGLALGAETVQTATLTIPQPGYYSIVASALSTDPIIENGILVQEAAVEEIWLLVDEMGGRVTKQFEANVLPDTVKSEAGPFRPRRTLSSPDRRLVPTATGDAIIKVVYFVADTSPAVYKPLQNAYITVNNYNVISGNYKSSRSGYTNPQGQFTLGCLGYEYEYTGSVWSRSPYLRVLYNGTDHRRYISGDYATCLYGDDLNSESIDNIPARVLDNANTYVPNSRSFFGRSLPRLDATIISTQCSKYANGGLEISTHANCDAVWGVTGAFWQAHEYGHGQCAPKVGRS